MFFFVCNSLYFILNVSLTVLPHTTELGIKLIIELLCKYPSNMTDRLRQLYHRYDWCEYVQLKIEFTASVCLLTMTVIATLMISGKQ